MDFARRNIATALASLTLMISAVNAAQPSSPAAKDAARRVPDAGSAGRPARTADPRTGLDAGEFLIDLQATPIPTPGSQASVASDGTNSLVVWTDSRRGTDYSIYGARVTPDGEVLDPCGIAISNEEGYTWAPGAAFDGENYLVVWTDGESGDIYGARVTTAGEVLDPEGIGISTAAYGQQTPAVAFGGGNYFVVWSDWRNGDTTDVYGARVTPAGEVLDASGIEISHENCRSPSAAFDGVDYFVVWADWRSGTLDVRGARVTTAGEVRDPGGIGISAEANDQWSQAIASDGVNCLVVWEDGRNGSNSDIYAARVAQDGTVLDLSGISVSAALNDQSHPAVTFAGGNYLVVWQDARNGGDDVYAARLTPDGAVLDLSGISVSAASNDQSCPAVTFAGGNYLTVWQDARYDAGDIYGARVTLAGQVLDPSGIVLSTAAYGQENPRAACDGTNYLVAWIDHRSGSHIYGARVTPTGDVLDQSGIPISTAATEPKAAAVAFDGTNYLVVWDETRGGSGRDVCGARVTQAGEVLDPSGILISTAANDQEAPAAAFDGTNYLVVWTDQRTGSHVYGARVTTGGVVIDPDGIILSSVAWRQECPALAFDGTNYLAVWEDCRQDTMADIFGTRVSPAGVKLDPDDIAISTEPDWQLSPAVAFGGGNYLAVWTDPHSVGGIYGARVTPTGVVLDPAGIPFSTPQPESPALVFDGTDYSVVWAQGHRGSDLVGARVTPGGSVLGVVPIVEQAGNQWVPALVRGAGDHLLLAYQGWTGIVSGTAYRNYRVWCKIDPFAGDEEGREPDAIRFASEATVVRGVLRLDPGSGVRPGPPCVLLDASGRRVATLRSGPNDVSRLAPGVYFARGPGSGNRSEAAMTVRRLVIVD